MSEAIYHELRLELRRFPYLSDKNRNDEEIDRLISNLFNSPSSMALEYDGGYLIFRNIGYYDGEKRADIFWIHFPGKPMLPSTVKDAKRIVDAAGKVMELDRITMRTASEGVVSVGRRLGLEVDTIEKDGFEWYGRKMPMFHLSKEV